MSEFLEYVLWQFQNSLVLVLLAGIVALAVIAVTYFFYKKKGKRFPWRKAALWLVFLGYLVIVLYATILRNAGGYREWNQHLFRAWREAWNNFSTKNWANVLLNIAMFVPLGFLLPLMGKQFRKWYVAIPAGFGTSFAIELAQLALKRGICDVDDLFCNGLGAAIGFFAIMAILAIWGEKGRRLKPTLSYVGLMLLPVIAIGSIFAVYHFQEYGNLPDAAAYRVSLDHLEWKVECALSESSESVPVYRTQTMSKADCAAFANEMAVLTGQEVDMVSYYQEMAYFNLTKGNMMVYYHDGSYEFGAYDYSTTAWEEVDRKTIEHALKLYPIVIPETAHFESEGEGWYSFTCDRHIDGAVMLDGTLRVRYGVDNSIRRIENHLVWYNHHDDVTVISQKEAYELLRSGAFRYAESLKNRSTDTVSVISCKLDYEIDTKGFYQPVYIFEILIPETGNTCVAMIPAMK